MNAEDRPVVITGMGVRCAIADDVPAFAAALRAGRSGIRRVPTGSAHEPPYAAPLADLDLTGRTGARYAGPVRRVAARAPRPVRVGVDTAVQAWRDARLDDGSVAPHRIGLVVAGHNLTGGYADALGPKLARSPAHVPGRAALHLFDTDHVGIVSEVLGLRGEGCTVGGASASGNVGIVHGARLIESGTADACLVLGALTELSALSRQAFANLGAMAMSGGCRPFDHAHTGFVAGEGCACLVLESRASAAARGAPVLAGLAGYAIRLDGAGLAEPSVSGEAAAMTEALARAGLDPADIGYVSTHGTGTPSGDRAEAAALHTVFGRGPAWVNATKELTGHCLHAAAVVEAVAAVVQLRSGFVHPNPALTDPIDDRLRFAGPEVRDSTARFALSNSFGFGGINTSVVLAGGSR